MNNLRRFVCLFLSAFIMCSATSCSVFMAAKQPKRKNLEVLKPGTSRGMVIAELGTPLHSEVRSGLKTDIFNFTQGYSTAAKTSRAVFHGAADVFTLGLWEVVGTPTEAVFDGKDMSVQVDYDSKDLVRKSAVLKQE